MLKGLPDFSCFKIFTFQCFKSVTPFVVQEMISTNYCRTSSNANPRQLISSAYWCR